ncbi:MAG: hypothetical protein ACM3Y9_11845 [Ignavibacteria bacterium]
MKKAIAVVVLLAVAAAGALYWLHGNLDGLVKDAIERYGSAMTGATVRVAAVEISPTDGRGVIRGLFVGNPPGFKTPYAVKVNQIDVAIDLSTVAGSVVTIDHVIVASPDVIYEKGDAGTNFDALQKNVAAYVGPSKNEGGKKLILSEFAMRGAQAQASAAFMGGKTVTVSLPDLVLHDLGKSKGGETPGELGQEIVAAMKQRLSASISFDRLAKSVSQGLESAGQALKGLFK